MVIGSKIIILDQFEPSSLCPIQIRMSENVFVALVIIVYLTSMTDEIGTTYLERVRDYY
jgi:hypothetical protein